MSVLIFLFALVGWAYLYSRVRARKTALLKTNTIAIAMRRPSPNSPGGYGRSRNRSWRPPLKHRRRQPRRSQSPR